MVFALAGATCFDGETFHDGLAVTVEGRHIRAIAPRDTLAPGVEVIALAGGILAPGFIDVQVNGGAVPCSTIIPPSRRSAPLRNPTGASAPSA